MRGLEAKKPVGRQEGEGGGGGGRFPTYTSAANKHDGLFEAHHHVQEVPQRGRLSCGYEDSGHWH